MLPSQLEDIYQSAAVTGCGLVFGATVGAAPAVAVVGICYASYRLVKLGVTVWKNRKPTAPAVAVPPCDSQSQPQPQP